MLNWKNGNLFEIDFNHPHFDGLEGVYVIQTITQPYTVRVGQGTIRDRLSAHKNDPRILAHQRFGLRAYWVFVPKDFRDETERKLAQNLRPVVGERFPQ
jgi:hypothetical protein